MAKSLLLVRHGLIAANRQRRWHGSTDSPLVWRGRRQARRVAKRLATWPAPPVALYTSPLQRCQDTAAQIGKHTGSLEAQVVAELREWAMGDWENETFKDLAKEHDFFAQIAADPNHKAPGDSESLAMVAQRIVRALRTISEAHNEEEEVVVVGHGAALAVGLAQLLDGDATRWSDYDLSNCSITGLCLDEVPYIEGFNSTAHL